MENLKGIVVNKFVSETKKYIETGKVSNQDTQENIFDGDDTGIVPKLESQGITFKGIKSTEKDGKVAVVTLQIHDAQADSDFDIKLNMRELDDGTWQVVEISNLVEFKEALDKAVQKKIDELNQPLTEQIDGAIHVTSIKANLQKENGFIPTAYLHYSLSYTLPKTDKKVSRILGDVILKDKDGNIVSKETCHIDTIAQSYDASDYASNKEFTYTWTRKNSLNPFIAREKKDDR